jgi:hypothetical protein
MHPLTPCKSYVQGINVLYATNTFFIESQALLDALFSPPRTHHLIPPQHLESITALELTWDLVLFGLLPGPTRDRRLENASARRRAADRAKVLQLRNMGAWFPNVRSLIVSFSEDLYRDATKQPILALEEIDRVLLRPLAEMAARLPQPLLHPLVVEIPHNVFYDISCTQGKRIIGLEEPFRDGHGLWLRYPALRRDGDAAAKDSCASSGLDVQAHDGFSYYIKEGIATDLFWDCDGKARSMSRIPADAYIIM